jgi:hypothetical protein
MCPQVNQSSYSIYLKGNNINNSKHLPNFYFFITRLKLIKKVQTEKAVCFLNGRCRKIPGTGLFAFTMGLTWQEWFILMIRREPGKKL